MDFVMVARGVVGSNDAHTSASEVTRVLRLLGATECEVARVCGLVCFGWEDSSFAEGL